MNLYHICNPENRRAQYFRDACQTLGMAAPIEVAWLDLLQQGMPDLEKSDFIRIESPGENFNVERLLIEKGGGPTDLAEDHGRLRCQPEWFTGWQKALREISTRANGATFINQPADIETMFDKYASQQLLEANDVPIPQMLGIVNSFDHLMDLMNQQQTRRVFLKPCHSSSASGVVALQTNNAGRIMAITSAELNSDQTAIYNSLRIRRYQQVDEVKTLVDLLSQENLMAERWFPKDSIDGKAYDLRILVIAGEARHVVARTSHSPITNLHLGNQRGVIADISARLGVDTWQAALTTAEKTASSFPQSHYIAVDLMIGSSRNRFAVAEVNAFGDLIPNIKSQGDDTYTAELRAFHFPK